MILLQKILAQWYYRILILVILCVTYYLTAVFTSLGSLLYNQETFTIYLLCGSFFIEGLRAKSTIFNIGLTLSKHAVFEFIYGSLYAVIPLVIIVCCAYLMGASTRLHDSIDVSSLYSTFEVMFFVALLEELLFRGIIFQSLHERFGPFAATLTLSLLFVIAHILNPNTTFLPLVNVILAGILLSCMYIATRNLWMPIAFHMIWNFTLGTVFNSPVSGIQNNKTTVLLIDWDKINQQYPLLFGGNFGLEGGIITTCLLIISTIFVVRFHSPSPFTVANLYRRHFAEQPLI